MKVSVIIPMYNAEKYLAACLDSVLAQTLTDFEVVIVDDCSTDSSCAVAESYLEKFGGRLKIISLPKNTGNASIPRNEGLRFSRSEYIFFMDNDDLLIQTALAELYRLAEDFQADAVYMERGFILDKENFTEATWNKNVALIDKPTLEIQDVSARVENFLRTGYGWAPWTKFLRRDFLIANKINFPHVKISEDVLWTFKVICLAENFLRVPNQLYVYRSAENSWSRVKRKPADEIKFWLDPLIKGLDYLDEFMDELNFFTQNPNYRFEVTNFFVKMQVAGMLDALKNLNRYELYEVIHGEFNGKHAALIANLFVVMNFYRDKFLEVKQ
ncbi:MAG: glycosyltransferase family 2 protein [Selenomonadaceae bacterium]|nr:glycosyltransferase family 2 protein [Selenomonadaceae bacterium]